jgi:RNA polymerase sigma-70 factor, ECF subfamily
MNSQGDFQEIYNLYQPKIIRYVTGMVGEADAEDITQEVFVKVHRALDNFRGDAKLSTWLYRIATNTALDHLRNPSFKQSAPNARVDILVETIEAEIDDRNIWTGEKTPVPEQQIVRRQMNECISSFIQKLPKNYRTVLLLSEFEGLKNNEIAEILGISLDTVKIRLHRAKKKLEVELAKNCDTYWIENNEFLPDLKNY